MTPAHARRALGAIIRREAWRFLQQRGRFISALVRPLLWLVVFAAGFRSVLGVSIIPPYATYVTYETYVLPGLLGMVLLFAGMHSSLSMVYDREVGSMRVLLTSPLPRWFALLSKLFAGSLVAVAQAVALLVIARLYGIRLPLQGFVSVIPALLIVALALGAIGVLLSSLVQQLENFAGVMNFVIFPMFFLSSALYPLWRMKEASLQLYWLCALNPFTHGVELIRFALYGKFNGIACAITVVTLVVFSLGAIVSYDPRSALVKRQIS